MPIQHPRGTAYEVRVAVYADDVALFTSGPTSHGRQVRESLQTAINAVDSLIGGVGLQFFATKTEAFLAHLSETGRYNVPKLHLRGQQLPWLKGNNCTYQSLRVYEAGHGRS